MDSGFIKYIRAKKDFIPVALALSLGLILLFIGSGNGRSSPVGEESIESRLVEVCSKIEGVGECEIIMYYSSDGTDGVERVESVILICEGADSVKIRLKLTEILSSFLGIGSNRIRIEKKKI